MSTELYARHSDPDTSQESMAAFDRTTMQSAVDTVIAIYRQHGPLADYRLKPLFATGWPSPCCDHLYRQARSVARDKGSIVDTGVREINPTTGRKQIVWSFNEVPVPPALRCCEACGSLLRRERKVRL